VRRSARLRSARRDRSRAIALTVAVAVGVVLPLARPSAFAIGLGALALLPLAALVLAGVARAATVAAALAYVGVLIWVYTTEIAPLYAYQGLVDADPEPTAALLTAALAALPAVLLPIAARRPSVIVLWLLYLVGYVPAVVVPLYIEGDLSTVLPFELALAGAMAVIIAIARLPPAPIAIPHLSIAGFTRLMVVLGLLFLAYVAVTFGIHPPPSLADVYARRAEFGVDVAGAAGAGYFVPWAGNAINPVLMTLGMVRRRATLVALGIAGQLLIYSATGFKSVLFSIVLVPLVYFAVSVARRSFGLLATVGAPLILFFAVAESFTGGASLGLARRLLATPGQIAWYYFEYFSSAPLYHLSHSFMRWFVPSAYSVDPPSLIGSVYFPDADPSANGNLWADGFANFGFAGLAGVALVFGLALWVVDGLGRGRDARIIGPSLAIAGLSLGNSALFTTMLTLGFGLSCVLMALMPPVADMPAPGSREHDDRGAETPAAPRRRPILVGGDDRSPGHGSSQVP
jgi:hypothetical protein